MMCLLLKCNVNSNIMQEISFKFYTDDEFNDETL